jgi:hypothetical protein
MRDLHTLNLSQFDIDIARQLSNIPRLRSLSINAPYLNSNDPTFNEALSLFAKYPLESLSIQTCHPLTNKGLSTFAECPIKNLSIEHCTQITDEAILALSRCPISSFSIRSCSRISEEGLLSLASHPIKSLTINDMGNITDRALSRFAKRSLTSLSIIWCNKITNEGILSFADCLLTNLDLDDSPITDATLSSFARCPLTTVSLLRCNEITDTGLLSLVGCPIESLFIRLCERITDAALSIFAKSLTRKQNPYDPDYHLNATPLDQIQESLAYHPQSALGIFYQAVLQNAPNLEELFSRLTPHDRGLICYETWVEGGRPQEDGWGERHLFDPQMNRCEVVKRAIRKKLSQAPDLNAVYGRIFVLAGSPQTNDPRYGRNHAIVNLCRLADALDH